MRDLALLLCAIFIISCNSIDKKVFEKEKIFLKHQIDSLKQLSENLTKTYSFLFDKALNLEESDKETAISIYKTIADTKNGDFWAVESEKKILNLSKEDVKKENIRFVFSKNFDWLYSDTLELSQQNGKCGEWGGDIERIRIFRKSGKLFGHYIKEIYNCDYLPFKIVYDEANPTNPPTIHRAYPTIYQSKEKEITTQQTKLLIEAILSLTEYQLNFNVGSDAGIVNKVQIKGENRSYKKIFVEDWYSFHWNTFHKLKNEILLQSQ